MHDPALRLKRIRGQRGLSQYKFARSLKVSLRSYQYYESGARPLPVELLHRLAELGINVHWIVTGDGARNLPPQEEIEKIKAMADYWHANYLKSEASLKLVRMRVREKYGGESVEWIPDQLTASPGKEMKDQLPASTSNTGTERGTKRK